MKPLHQVLNKVIVQKSSSKFLRAGLPLLACIYVLYDTWSLHPWLQSTTRWLGTSVFAGFFLLLCARDIRSGMKLRILEHPSNCSACSFNLTGNESGVCPECGTEIEKT